MKIVVAILIGAALIAGSVAVSHRYAITAHACSTSGGDCTRVWLMDQWTGRISMCEYAPDSHSPTIACLSPRGIK